MCCHVCPQGRTAEEPGVLVKAQPPRQGIRTLALHSSVRERLGVGVKGLRHDVGELAAYDGLPICHVWRCWRVVHRDDGERKLRARRLRRFAVIRCGDEYGESGRCVGLQRRAAEGARFGIEVEPARQCAMIGKCRSVGDTVALRVVDRGKLVGERLVFGGGLIVDGSRLWRVVDRSDADGHGCSVSGCAVAHGVVEAAPRILRTAVSVGN